MKRIVLAALMALLLVALCVAQGGTPEADRPSAQALHAASTVAPHASVAMRAITSRPAISVSSASLLTAVLTAAVVLLALRSQPGTGRRESFPVASLRGPPTF